jgi:hypothetical protein
VTGAEATIIAGIVGAGSAVIASAVATFGTYRVTKRSGNEDRKQERIRDAYVTIQLYVNKWGNYATWTANPELIAQHLRPELPTVSDEAEAVAALMASDKIVAAVKDFNKKLDSFRSALGVTDEAQRTMNQNAPETVSQLGDSWMVVIRTADELTDAAERVHLQMRKELAGA